MAVGWSAPDGLGGESSTLARVVLDDEWLAEPFRQPSTHYARSQVGRAPGSKAHDQAYRSRWIGLRPRHRRQGRRGDSRGGTTQEFPTNESHGASSSAPVGLCPLRTSNSHCNVSLQTYKGNLGSGS